MNNEFDSAPGTQFSRTTIQWGKVTMRIHSLFFSMRGERGSFHVPLQGLMGILLMLLQG